MAKAKTPRKSKRKSDFSYDKLYKEGGQCWAHREGGGWCTAPWCHKPCLNRDESGTLIHQVCLLRLRGTPRR